MIDLHAHTTFSDGSLTPEQLAALAAETGLTAVALTDHDSTEGVARFVAACRRLGVEGVPDIPHGTLHMLGYFMDIGDAHLQDVLGRIREGREERNHKILAKLKGMGYALTWDEVAAYAGEDVVGRPHFAQALLARGFVSDKDDAFNRLLGKGQPAYVDRYRLTPADSVALIRDAGGVPVLAHPFTLDLPPKALRATMAELKQLGLAGIETYYSEHTPEMVRQYERLAEEFDLVRTGGSDFHGDANPKVRLGSGFGALHVADDLLDGLKARRRLKEG
jgi:predicted metal-dependent phosphoesterase TrpH